MYVHLLLALAVPSVSSFSLQSSRKSLATHEMSSSGFSDDTETKAPFSTNEFPKFEDVELPKFDDMEIPTLDNLRSNIKASIGNFAEGGNGEQFLLAEAFLVLSIIGNGIPFLQDPLKMIAGPGLMVAGALATFASFVELGSKNDVSLLSVPSDDTELINSGLYEYVRHPMYSGLLTFMTGLGVWTQSAPRLILTFALYLVIDSYVDREESELEQNVIGYGNYKDNMVTERFFPLKLVNEMRASISGFTKDILQD